ncbi:MAG: hypothetical protein RSF73_06565 [Ruthenibacterium sp.]
MNLNKANPFVQGENFPYNHKRAQNACRRIVQSDVAYVALIYNLDENVGRLVEALKQKLVLWLAEIDAKIPAENPAYQEDIK